ncbi:molybdenum ABC transporter permease [Rothia kristinae]|uniref:Molybdenum ABC transporter permease n=1 Tax=Rothia kristinae TaxID=37923 RepID=A0A1S2MYJ7_9MICC|nr:ABC transporter permease subunit [Rothia kristinae]OIJ35397.1 molybdenum ABC transporter permease [Rothia kristinae]
MPRSSSANYAFPVWLYLPAGIAFLLILGPLAALVGHIPWPRLGQLLAEPSARSALRLSLGTAATATGCCLVVGLPLSLLLARALGDDAARTGAGPGHRLARLGTGAIALVVYAPLVLSPVVSGLAMTYFWGRQGWLGRHLEPWGLGVDFTSWAVVLVQVFVALPFFVATTVTALRSVPRRFEEIAATEGATRGEVVRRVLIPHILPGLATAMLLSFARALGEYGATITFAGNIAGITRTIPLNIEIALNSNDVPAALGSCIMLLALYLMVVGFLGLAQALGGLRRGV